MKSKPLLIVVVVVGLMLAGFFVVGLMQEPPLDWTATFSRHDKQPYGASLVFERLGDLFPGQKIGLATESAGEQLRKAQVEEQGAPHISQSPGGIGAYLLIGSNYPCSDDDFQAIAAYVRQGGTVLISDQRQESDRLTDFLNISRVASVLQTQDDSSNLEQMRFTDLASGRQMQLSGHNLYFSFGQLPSVAKVLIVNQKREPVFVQIPYGAGNFFACAVPHLYTNYSMLKSPGDELLATMFSYLPNPTAGDSKVLWDEYYKHEGHARREMQQNLFRFIYKYPTLKWAFFLMLTLVGVYLLSELRRKQREIPIEEPLPNATLEFAGTIGSLYFKNGDHRNIADKKIRYFYEFVRNRFFIRINENDEQSLPALAGRSGIAEAELLPLFVLIRRIRHEPTITEAQLIDLSSRLDQFYQLTAS